MLGVASDVDGDVDGIVDGVIDGVKLMDADGGMLIDALGVREVLGVRELLWLALCNRRPSEPAAPAGSSVKHASHEYWMRSVGSHAM